MEGTRILPLTKILVEGKESMILKCYNYGVEVVQLFGCTFELRNF